MTWLALRAVLARVPGIVWAFVFVAALALVGLAFTYHAGRVAGELSVRRDATQDSVRHAVAVLDTAVQTTERARRVATKLAAWGDTSRATRRALRDSVEAVLPTLPAPVVTLIRRDDDQIRRDSATITAFAVVDSSWLAERRARIDADSLESHLARLEAAPAHTHRAWYVVGAVAAFAAGVLLHAAVR